MRLRSAYRVGGLWDATPFRSQAARKYPTPADRPLPAFRLRGKKTEAAP